MLSLTNPVKSNRPWQNKPSQFQDQVLVSHLASLTSSPVVPWWEAISSHPVLGRIEEIVTQLQGIRHSLTQMADLVRLWREDLQLLPLTETTEEDEVLVTFLSQSKHYWENWREMMTAMHDRIQMFESSHTKIRNRESILGVNAILQNRVSFELVFEFPQDLHMEPLRWLFQPSDLGILQSIMGTMHLWQTKVEHMPWLKALDGILKRNLQHLQQLLDSNEFFCNHLQGIALQLMQDNAFETLS